MNEMERQALARKNTIALRNYHGESKTDLAKAIGYNGPNAIWNLESGKQRIPEDIMEKIESHYMIQRGSLSTVDYTDITSLRIILQKEKLKELALKGSPLVTSKLAEKDPLFLEAYRMHISMIDSSISGSDCELSIEELADKYAISYDENDTIESLINLVALFLNLASAQNNEWLYEFTKGILSYDSPAANGDLSKKERHTLFAPILNRTTSEHSQLEEEPADQSFDESIVECLKTIKEDGTYADIAYYYMAMRYVGGIVENDNDFQTNQGLGFHMLYCLSAIGNSYAEAYLTALATIFSE